MKTHYDIVLDVQPGGDASCSVMRGPTPVYTLSATKTEGGKYHVIGRGSGGEEQDRGFIGGNPFQCLRNMAMLEVLTFVCSLPSRSRR